MYFTSSLLLNVLVHVMFDGSVAQSDCSDCCVKGKYKEIDEPRRSIKSIWKVGQNALCDINLPWGWYRFTSFTGGEMPTSIVNPNRCGTAAPVWIKKANPSEKDGTVVREACINFFGINNGCSQSFNIKVRNCSSYYVYFLGPTYSCAVAYCAGTKEPCPYGKVGEPDDCFDPPVQFDMSLIMEPKIGPESLGNDPAVDLRCEAALINPSMQSWRNVSYQFTWYMEGKHIHTDDVCGILEPGRSEYESECPGKPLFSRLHGKYYKPNRLISCNVTARYTTSPWNIWSTPKAVLFPFFAGIKVEPSVLTLRECSLNETYSFTLTPTIPIHNGLLENGLTIGLWLPADISVDNDECQITLEGLTSKTVRLFSHCNDVPGSGSEKLISLRVENSHSEFWNTVPYLPAIRVSVEDESDNIGFCDSYMDPHYFSFLSYFTFMGHGDFILYSNAERKFEIHTRQWVCSERAETCNCGAVIRDHNDVIEFNCCNENRYFDHVTPLRVQVRSKKRLAPGLSITQTIPGFYSRYKVLLPSGGKVYIYRNWFGLNVFLTVPRSKNISSESGLCLYDNEQNVTSFGNAFRLEPSESYFNRLPKPVNDAAVQYEIPCSCHREDENGKAQCEKQPLMYFPNVMDNTDGEQTRPGNSGMGKRDTHISDDLTDEDQALFKGFFGSNKSHRRKRALSNKRNFTRQNATDYCMEKVSKTDIGKLCATLGINVLEIVTSCSIDLEATNDPTFAISAMSVLLNDCGQTVARNLSSYSNESSNNNQGDSSSSILSNIAQRMCPNDCSLNGKCVNGSCICNEGFTAKDCSMSLQNTPFISMLQGNGLCDKRQRPCTKVTVMGSDFINSINLTCHTKEYKIINSSWTPNGTIQRFPGVMTDLVLVECHLPESPVKNGFFDDSVEGTPAAGLTISVSNDGENPSHDELLFISYDSGCMSCNISTGCFVKSNSCIINQYCFAANEINPTDFCTQCLPDINKNSWTKRKVNLAPQFTSNSQYFAVFQETLELPIDVLDPEGMPVVVSLMNGGSAKAIIRENVLIWNVTKDVQTHFFLKATDACQAFSTHNITVTLNKCECQNHGKCVPHQDKPRGSGYYECHCIPGFTGDKCEIDIDDCQSYPCLRGRCVDEVDNFTCICYPGYVGRTCNENYDDCSSLPCIHGNCTDYVNAYGCSCEAGYTGKNCSIDIDDCQSSPCKNGICYDVLNGYTCQCYDGFTGYDCAVNIDECKSYPCIHGTCVDQINNFTCHCKAGFTGPKCEEDINECLQLTCGNGTCVDLVNNYTCNCYAGFTGRNCDIMISNCTKDSCYPNVTCYENSNSINCGSCPPELTGDGKICEEIDECVNHTCGNGGSCVDGVKSYTCICLAGFTGDQCETNIDDCFNHTCDNGAACVDGLNNFSCSCLPGYTGELCKTDIDECVNHTCANGAFCIDGVNNFSCNCRPGYTGERCETAFTMRFTSVISAYASTTAASFPSVERSVFSAEILINSKTESIARQHISATSAFKYSIVSSTVAQHISTTEGREKTTTSKPTTADHEDEISVKIHIERTWNEDLRDEGSTSYKELASIIEDEIRKQYSAVKNFIGVQIIAFRPGSIVAEFKLLFAQKFSEDKALAPLKKAVENGKLGPLAVDPKSLKILKEEEDPTEDAKVKIPYPLTIGASCVVIFALVLVSICIVRHFQRRKRLHGQHFSNRMLADVPFPNPEIYELNKAQSKENIVTYGELGIWKDSSNYEKLHFSNGGALNQEKDVVNMVSDYQEIGKRNDYGHYQEIEMAGGPERYQEIGIFKRAGK